jgi:hypothetical protein
VIEGYEDYSISDHGRIISFKGQFGIGKILNLYLTRNGYVYVILYKSGFSKHFTIHRLVGIHFLKNINPDLLIEINHIDENKQNNHISNLEWCTSQYNSEYSTSKTYIIQFPNGDVKRIKNLCKFCQENNLDQSGMWKSFKKGYSYKQFNVLNIIDKYGKIKTAKELKRKTFKIINSNQEIIIVTNLSKFSKENNLDVNCMCRTLKKNCFHRGFKIIEKIDKFGNITTPK